MDGRFIFVPSFASTRRSAVFFLNTCDGSANDDCDHRDANHYERVGVPEQEADRCPVQTAAANEIPIMRFIAISLLGRPYGTLSFFCTFPGLPPWAKLVRPFGARICFGSSRHDHLNKFQNDFENRHQQLC